ncbi:hypothetical protein LY11_00703 [Pedobacter cryoconitis]|uniref:Uncharacterized protein n=1 Tax=Pedobacter cryoconitis TaxID=188932 RepID=A0A327T1E2_9SPHI|nr:hypothetical protein LY11_00703 [Pedobacter cryoconitis]
MLLKNNDRIYSRKTNFKPAYLHLFFKTNYLKYKELCRLDVPIFIFTHMCRIGFLSILVKPSIANTLV